MIQHLRRLAPFGLLSVVTALVLGAGVASAHADYVSSTPAAGAVLSSAPSSVTIVFSEELNASGNSITVTDASGAQVDNSDTTLDKSDADRKTVTVTLKSGLGNGTYTVAWVNSSADGHSEEGDFTFSVGAASATAPTTLPATGANDLNLVAIIAAAMLLLGLGFVARRAAR